MRRAVDFQRRGLAKLVPEGLFFLRLNQEQRKLEAQRRQEREITVMRNGVFWWNGADPGSMDEATGRRTEAHHGPFENTAIPGPGKPWCARWIKQQGMPAIRTSLGRV